MNSKFLGKSRFRLAELAQALDKHVGTIVRWTQKGVRGTVLRSYLLGGQRYVDHEDVAEPSVMTLNVLSAGEAANHLMMMFTGLFKDGVELRHELNFVRELSPHVIGPRADEFCLDCGTHSRSRRGRGDRMRLPCRMPQAT